MRLIAFFLMVNAMPMTLLIGKHITGQPAMFALSLGSDQIDATLVAAQPRYIVERMPDVTESSGAKSSYYRITAQGIGKDSNAIVIVQTMYKFQ